MIERKKIMFPAIFLTLILVVSMIGCVEDADEGDWTWDLTPNVRWNKVTFTQEQIDSCISDAPLDVFSSLADSSINIVVYQDYSGDGSDWRIWRFWDGYENPGDTLKNIRPDIVTSISVSSACTLVIHRIVPID